MLWWKLTSPKICNWQVEDLGELVRSYSSCLSLKAREMRAEGLSSSRKAIGLKTQKDSMFSFKSKGQCPRWSSQSRGILLNYGRRWSAFFFYSIYSNITLIQKLPYRHNQKNVWPNIWASGCPVKLTHKINHHKDLSPSHFVPASRRLHKILWWSTFLVYPAISHYYSSWKLKVKDILKPLNWFAMEVTTSELQSVPAFLDIQKQKK